MNKLISTALIAGAILGAAAPALANDNETIRREKADVRASQGAIAKDNAAIAAQHDNLRENRAEKAKAKASGDLITQAGESLSIGANQAVIGVKEGEKNIDQEILENDKEDVRDAKRKAAK